MEGSMSNFHPGLVNLDMRRAVKDGANLHRYSSPGAGAITLYNNVRYMLTKDLPAGTELFLEYGNHWLIHRENTMGKVSFGSDYERADGIVAAFSNISSYQNYKAFTHIIWSFIKDELTIDERLRAALPVDIEDVEEAVKLGTAIMTVPDVTRSLPWLHRNGRCLDNLRQGQSNILHAGRGVFARRDFKKGEIITSSPLIHIRRDSLRILEIDEKNDVHELGQQLLLNYCYSHHESSVLLYPYAPMTNLINHSSREDSNIRIQWSNLPSHKESWVKESSNFIHTKEDSGLIIDYVATTDILEGEEVLLNYGSRWQDAWEKHILAWEPSFQASSYISSWDILLMNTDHLKTVHEGKKCPNTDNLMTVCFLPEDIEYAEIRKGAFGEERIWFRDAGILDLSENGTPCKILDVYRSESDSDLYVIEADLDDSTIFVRDIPRKFISFVDKAYSTDEFLPGAFRHEIELPDDLFPITWKDRKE